MRLPRPLVVGLLIVIPALMRASHFERSLIPMGALALFCGAHFRNRWLALSIPLASMLLGDVLIGLSHENAAYSFHATLPFVYACYALNVLFGMGLGRYWERLKVHRRHAAETQSFEHASTREPSPLITRVLPIAGATLAGALIFFFVTNFATWYFYDFYAKTWQGLGECYVAAIPFFTRGTLLADVLGAVLFFGGDYLLEGQFAEQPEAERV
jgi:hypothetical protein